LIANGKHGDAANDGQPDNKAQQWETARHLP
jgi:hypothetical protein